MIAIVDCNNFYCGCERLFYPALAQRPVVVLSNNDGCIISRTDEAKALGVGMAAPFFEHKALIEQHDIAVFSSNYNLYGDMSRRVMDTLRSIVGLPYVEVYSVDEAFLNLAHYPAAQLHATAVHIKETVELWTGIKVSVGVAPTKVLAKAANWVSKKYKQQTGGVVVLNTREKTDRVLQKIAVGDIWGVGRKYAEKLKSQNIHTGFDLSKITAELARSQLGGVVGERLLRELNGIAAVDLESRLADKKMIATTRMFGHPVGTLSDLKEAVATYTARAAEKLRRQNSVAGRISVFVVVKEAYQEDKYRHGRTLTLHFTFPVATASTGALIKPALALVEQLFEPGLKYAKAGVTLSEIVPQAAVQQNIFETETPPNRQALMLAVDNVNFSMRNDVVKFAASGTTRNWKMRQEHRSPRHSTRWEELRQVH